MAGHRRSLTSENSASRYASVFDGDELWRAVSVAEGKTFAWDADSPTCSARRTSRECRAGRRHRHRGARVLAVLGDSVTTDHISPAGSIGPTSPAGELPDRPRGELGEFNSYGARRGNHEVMVRGTFANVRLRNQLAPGTEGGFTLHLPDGERTTIFDAAMRYQADGVPAVVLAGKEYGTGSSRDWAAKGTELLGVRAVVAESYERIHRSNLVGMGVLPLQYAPGQSAASLGLTGHEVFSISGCALNDGALPKEVAVRAERRGPDVGRVQRPGAHRHPDGGRVLPLRRHPALRLRQLAG